MQRRFTWSLLVLFAAAMATLATPSRAQKPDTDQEARPAAATTKPAAPTTLPVAKLDPKDEALTGAALALRAQQAFNRGEYATALPLLRKMANEAADQPAKLGSIQERMRVCEKALAALKEDPQSAATAKPGQPTEETRKPHTPPKAGEVVELTIQNLGNFSYDQERGGQVPDDVAKLTGSAVRLRGYMIPMDQAENITQFALVPSLFACCFGQPPQIQHTIVCNTPKGKAVGYTPDEILVEGKLKVEEKKDEGYVISLFEMEVGRVKMAPK
jgi:hypothetical protein